ncbi:putative RNA-directed DNA polymerase, eukaryota, reverse transcriptase zinc-binding domain protein [Tanacetum coccineum]
MASNNTLVNVSQPQIPIFKGDSYEFWSIKMKTLFKSQGLWEFVESGLPEESSENARQKENIKKDAKALFFIQQAVDESIFSRIAAATSSKHAWDTLKTEYQGSAKVISVKLQSLLKNFETTSMKNDETVQGFLAKVSMIVSQMRAYGDNITDETVVAKILRSLPPKFDHVVAAIEESKYISTLSFDEFMGSLQAHEVRINRIVAREDEQAFHTTEDAEPSKRNQYTRGRGRGSYRGRGRSRTNLLYCSHCDKNGHSEVVAEPSVTTASRLTSLDIPAGANEANIWKAFAKQGRVCGICLPLGEEKNNHNGSNFGVARDVSDHCPLLHKSHCDNFGPIPFKFFNSWLLNDEFPTIFSQSWSSTLMSSATTHPAIILKEKLQLMKKHIRMWRSNATSNSDNLIQDLKDKVEVLDAKAENGCLVNHETETRISLLKQLEDQNHIKRLDLMQKAKIKWAIEDDENSKLFSWVHKHKEIKDAVWDCGGGKVPASKKNERLFLFKVDFEKAFDSLDWNLLDNVMQQMGFSHKWRKWICGCLTSSFNSVIVNGSPTKEFDIQCGIHQGDPLSPFLFIIAVKALHVTFQEAKAKGIFDGVKIGSNKVDVSQLQFADDALILGKWSLENARTLCRILKVNFSKSKLFDVGVNATEIQSFANILDCQASTFPCSYLGLPIGANMSKACNWKPIIVKFHKRLASWKARNLSYGGRLTLLESVLGALGLNEEDEVTVAALDPFSRTMADAEKTTALKNRSYHKAHSALLLALITRFKEFDVCTGFARDNRALSAWGNRKENGVARHLTVAGTPQQNGLAERMNGMLLNKVRCLLIQSGLPDSFWAEATVTAEYLINRSPSTALKKKTPKDYVNTSGALQMLRILVLRCLFTRKSGEAQAQSYKVHIPGDTRKGAGGCKISGKEVKFEVELKGSRVKPTMDPHTGENLGNEDEEQDEGPQQQNLDNYVLVRDREKRTITIPAIIG